ncbi:putative RNA-directed DNA polymerase from transposon BS [Amphibalanus amphitrite]|uniref:Putative RNA-directed DNA polymerase from transposon BS n=1 Tax=Amphibalanus amphitrite TaxID=1232801 RepID=A0A6A4W2L9_AMPAM|nr:putative RNA-directed DNA polymerase from transposon BS [Amphibalanus amphitrite]
MLLTVRSTPATQRTRRKAKWAFQKADWVAFRADCEDALCRAVPQRATAQELTTRFTEAVMSASRRHIPRGARPDAKPWALDPELQQAVSDRPEARRQIRADDPASKERWIAAKRRAADVERRATQAHFRTFVEDNLNQPASLGRVTKILKKWEGAGDEHQPGQAMRVGGRLLVTDREKAQAFCATYAHVSRQRVPGTTAFLYADDTAALCAGNDIQVARQRAQQAADTLAQWAQANKMTVAGQKTQALVLSQWPRDAANCSVKVAGETVTAGDQLKLLGVTLDRLLHFGPHCRSLRQRVRPRTAHLRKLTGREWGLQEQQLRVVASGYVRGALEHAAAAWLPATSPTHLGLLEVEMRAAARVVTGCPRSTPAHGLMAEAGLASVAERRTALAARLLAKARALPEDDPLRAVADGEVRSRLSTVSGWRGVGEEAWREAGITPPISIEPLLPRPAAPWEPPPPVSFCLDVGAALPPSATDEQRRDAASHHLAGLPQCATWVWTDGSATEGVTNGGAGALIVWPDDETAEIRTPAGRICSSYRAEMVALRAALNHLLEHPAHTEDPVVICTDSQSALAALREGPAAQSSPLGSEIWDALRRLTTGGRRIHLQWVPSHCGLGGNEETDRLAGEAGALDQEDTMVDVRTIHRAAARTVEELAAYDMEIRHVPGRLNAAADMLSRVGAPDGAPPAPETPADTGLPPGLILSHRPEGGGDSLVECLCLWMSTNTLQPAANRELRAKLIDEACGALAPALRLMRLPGQPLAVELLAVFACLFDVRVLVHFGPDHHMTFCSARHSKHGNIHLHCLAGIHFNLLAETGALDEQNPVLSAYIVNEERARDGSDQGLSRRHSPEAQVKNLQSEAEETRGPACGHLFSSRCSAAAICNGQAACALLDSGAAVSLCSADSLGRLGFRDSDVRRSNVALQGLAGLTFGTEYVEAEVPLSPEMKTVRVPLLIERSSSFGHCLLLGVNFLHEAGAIIDLNQREVTCGNRIERTELDEPLN